jgi:hypothetical protein
MAGGMENYVPKNGRSLMKMVGVDNLLPLNSKSKGKKGLLARS